ncbi:hypothetical protein Pcinc_027331 [Petrolisthes cinctipes]|nr:hypothetical protein Pcinc_027331 [Petrolisthes cinctipes]
MYGRARCLDSLAEEEQSNTKLDRAILTYRGVVDLADEHPTLVPLKLLLLAAERCIDRMQFRGMTSKALRVQQRLLQRFPEDVNLRNKMGLSYVMMSQYAAAKEVFETVLNKWPNNGFALVHYGYVLRTHDQNNTGAAWYLSRGIESREEGTQDSRFYYGLGDVLQRLGKSQEAYKVYDEAVEKGMLMSRYQRSLYNVDRLTSRPLWTHEQTTYHLFFRNLEQNWELIRDEAIAIMNMPPQNGFLMERENLRETGEWKMFELFSRGRKLTANCVNAPQTCALIENFAPASGCKRGQVKFSLLEPGTHVHSHTGPTNCRLRAHLGLVVPDGVRLRVIDEIIKWEEGKIFIFDDSFEHEVWNEGNETRLVLLIDVWHPDLTEHERRTLDAI